MVDLAKIRKKAKGGGQRAAGGGREKEKLERFVAEAGVQRFERKVAVDTAADQIEMLTFTLGAEQYAVDIDRIVEIIPARPATRVPNVDPFVIGIISLRGSIVTLVDVRSRLRQPARNSERDGFIIVTEENGGLVGFEVDRVLRPAKIDRAAIEPQPVVDPAEQSEAIRGLHRTPSALTILLDLGKLLR